MKSFHKYSPIPTYIWQVQDKEFILLNYNDAAKQITSGKIANIPGSKASDMYGDMPDILQDFERCSEEKSSFQRDMYYHFKTTGDDKYLSVKYAYVPPDFILVHTEDITERKKIEEGLAKINRCLLSLGTDINENINHLVTLCGELMGAACALYNKLDKGILCSIGQWNTPPDYIAEDNPVGHICYDVIKQESNQPFTVRNLQQSHYAQTDHNVLQYNLRTYVGIPVKCNEKFVGSLCVVYQRDFEPGETDLEIMGIIASALENQENYHAAKNKLKESSEQYRILYEENPSMYFTVDEAGIVLSVNNFGANQLGFTKNELIGKSVISVFHDKDKKSVAEQLSVCLQNPGQVMTWKFRKIKKDGTVIWVKEVVRSIEDAVGNKTILIVCEDITERIKAKIEKTEILKKLAKTEKLAILGQMTAAIAHEINNPLDILQTKLYFLQKKLIDNSKNQDLWDDITKIKLQINRLDQFSKKILNYAKPQSFKLLPVPIKQILDRSIEVLEDYFSEFITLKIKWDENIPLIQGDEIGLEIVFNNLILNSLESIHEAGKITITGKIFNNQMIEIKIQDTGAGIAEADLQKIFDPFFTTKNKQGGTGLGLAMSKYIIEQHRGQIVARSQPNTGTEFSIYLYINPET